MCRQRPQDNVGAAAGTGPAQPIRETRAIMLAVQRRPSSVKQALPFRNPYRHDFVRVAVAVPRLRVADPAFNAAESLVLLERAAKEGAVLVAFPELGLSAYT